MQDAKVDGAPPRGVGQQHPAVAGALGPQGFKESRPYAGRSRAGATTAAIASLGLLLCLLLCLLLLRRRQLLLLLRYLGCVWHQHQHLRLWLCLAPPPPPPPPPLHPSTPPLSVMQHRCGGE